MYLEEAHSQLRNAEFYVKLPADPTEIFTKKLQRLLQTGRDIQAITKKEFKFLKVEHPQVPTFLSFAKGP